MRLFAVALAAIAAPLALGLYVLVAAIVPRDDGRVLLGGSPGDRRESLLGWSLVGITLIWFAAEEFRLGGLVWPALSSFGVFAAATSALVLLALAQRREATAGRPRRRRDGRRRGGGRATRARATTTRRATAATRTRRAGRPRRGTRRRRRRAEPTGAGRPRASRRADLVPAAAASWARRRRARGARRRHRDRRRGGDDAVRAARAARPPRRGPSLAVIGFGVLLIAAAGIFLLDAVGQIDLTATAVAATLGAGAALAGAGAIAAAVTQRRGAIGLIVLGVLLGGAPRASRCWRPSSTTASASAPQPPAHRGATCRRATGSAPASWTST